MLLILLSGCATVQTELKIPSAQVKKVTQLQIAFLQDLSQIKTPQLALCLAQNGAYDPTNIFVGDGSSALVRQFNSRLEFELEDVFKPHEFKTRAFVVSANYKIDHSLYQDSHILLLHAQPVYCGYGNVVWEASAALYQRDISTPVLIAPKMEIAKGARLNLVHGMKNSMAQQGFIAKK
ncbi:hypothetical protein NT239_11045 [Chitinibacter sp. SCUT-21]|uniref:hypothetical protein n=1 Tax=Chitinibacter sp. SCUT-21 TaxID=2970891 RepID=UPI0035A68222